MRTLFHSGLNQMPQKYFASIAVRSGRALHDDWTVAGIRSLHDGLYLFHIADVESRYGKTMFRGVIQKLS
jgi:hypothetical protein